MGSFREAQLAYTCIISHRAAKRQNECVLSREMHFSVNAQAAQVDYRLDAT